MWKPEQRLAADRHPGCRTTAWRRTTVPILAKGKTVTGRIWTYVRDGTFSVLEKAAA